MKESLNNTESNVLERLDVATCEDHFQVYLHEQRYRRALELVSQNDDLLEIGTGLGVFSSRVAPVVSIYRGVEYDEITCGKAKDRVSNPDWITQGDAQALEFEVRTFDVVVCLEVFEHLPDFRKALDEICRVLRPDGRLIASIPYVKSGAPSKTNPHHIYEPGESEFTVELAKRFKDVSVSYQRYSESTFETWARKLRLRRLVGLSSRYAKLSMGVPEEMTKIRLDEQRSGMLLGLFTIASTPKSR